MNDITLSMIYVAVWEGLILHSIDTGLAWLVLLGGAVVIIGMAGYEDRAS